MICPYLKSGLFWNYFFPRNALKQFAYIFVPRYGIPSIFLFRGMVRNGIPRVLCSAEQPEFRRNKPICFVYYVFPLIIFLSEIPD